MKQFWEVIVETVSNADLSSQNYNLDVDAKTIYK